MESNNFVYLILVGSVFGFFCLFIANEKNRNPFGWFVLGFCFSIVALLALMALPKITREEKTLFTCSSCGVEVGVNDKFCNNCGESFEVKNNEVTKKFCSNCGIKLNSNDKFCSSCGIKVTT